MLESKLKDVYSYIKIEKEKNPRYYEGVSATEKIPLDNLISILKDGWKINSSISIAKVSKEDDFYYVVDGNRRLTFIEALNSVSKEDLLILLEANQMTLNDSNISLIFQKTTQERLALFNDILEKATVYICENQLEINSVYEDNHGTRIGFEKWQTINKIIRIAGSEQWENLKTPNRFALAIFNYVVNNLKDRYDKLSIEVTPEYTEIIDESLDILRKSVTVYPKILFVNDFNSEFPNFFTIPSTITDNSIIKCDYGQNYSNLVFESELIEKQFIYALIVMMYIKKLPDSWNNDSVKLGILLRDYNYPLKDKILNLFGIEKEKPYVYSHINPEDIEIKDIITDKVQNTKEILGSYMYDIQVEAAENLTANIEPGVIFISYSAHTYILTNFIVREILIKRHKIDKKYFFMSFIKDSSKAILPPTIIERYNMLIKKYSEYREDYIRVIKQYLSSKNTFIIFNITSSYILKEFTVLEAGNLWLSNKQRQKCTYLYPLWMDGETNKKLQLPNNDTINYSDNRFIFDIDEKNNITFNKANFSNWLNDLIVEIYDFCNNKKIFDEPREVVFDDYDEIKDLFKIYLKEFSKDEIDNMIKYEFSCRNKLIEFHSLKNEE